MLSKCWRCWPWRRRPAGVGWGWMRCFIGCYLAAVVVRRLQKRELGMSRGNASALVYQGVGTVGSLEFLGGGDPTYGTRPDRSTTRRRQGQLQPHGRGTDAAWLHEKPGCFRRCRRRGHTGRLLRLQK